MISNFLDLCDAETWKI